jgi:hypothetical protein
LASTGIGGNSAFISARLNFHTLPTVKFLFVCVDRFVDSSREETVRSIADERQAPTGDAMLVFHRTCCCFLIPLVQWFFGRAGSRSRSFSWVKLLSHRTCRPASSVETELSTELRFRSRDNFRHVISSF